MTSPNFHRARAPRGFTIVEALIAILTLSLGIAGVLGIQSAAISSSRFSYDQRAAINLAETTLERLKRDAIEWQVAGTYPAGSWLNTAMSGASLGQWVYPPIRNSVVPTYNDLALPGVVTRTGAWRTQTRNSRFCIEYRMSWASPTSTAVARAEVRVAWPRGRRGQEILGVNCANIQALTPTERRQNFHVVQMTGLVTRNDISRQL